MYFDITPQQGFTEYPVFHPNRALARGGSACPTLCWTLCQTYQRVVFGAHNAENHLWYYAHWHLSLPLQSGSDHNGVSSIQKSAGALVSVTLRLSKPFSEIRASASSASQLSRRTIGQVKQSVGCLRTFWFKRV